MCPIRVVRRANHYDCARPAATHTRGRTREKPRRAFVFFPRESEKALSRSAIIGHGAHRMRIKAHFGVALKELSKHNTYNGDFKVTAADNAYVFQRAWRARFHRKFAVDCYSVRAVWWPEVRRCRWPAILMQQRDNCVGFCKRSYHSGLRSTTRYSFINRMRWEPGRQIPAARNSGGAK